MTLDFYLLANYYLNIFRSNSEVRLGRVQLLQFTTRFEYKSWSFKTRTDDNTLYVERFPNNWLHICRH